MKLPWRAIFLLLGLAVFGWFSYHIDPSEIWANIRQLGWRGLLVPIPFFIVYVIDAYGWKLSFGRTGLPGIRYLTYLRIRWCGESLNYILPTAYVGGEAVKVYLLHKRGVSPTVSASASVVSKSCQTLAMVIFIAGGAVAGLPYLPDGSAAKQGMVTVAALAFVAIGALFWLQRRGIFRTVLVLTRLLHFKIAALEKQEERFSQMDDRVRRFYREEPGQACRCTLVFLMGWLGDTMEIFLVSHLLGFPLDWQQAYALEAFIAVSKAVGMFSPGSIGVQESGVMFLFHIFGLPAAAGVSYALIRRGRELVFGLTGWGLIVAEEHSISELHQHMKEASDVRNSEPE